MKKWLKNIAALCFGLFLSLLLVEIVLHIYNPFQSRVRGGKIILPVNLRYEFDNEEIAGLDKHIVHQKNKYGFRGPLLNDADSFRIFCVGGSTTECFYLSDGADWPAMVGQELKKKYRDVWVNNAGLDGHSTWGHIVLLRDHLLQFHPQMVAFLVGCNDVAANGLNRYEKYHIDRKMRILEYSELFGIYQNYRKVKAARERGLGHHQIDVKHAETADTTGWNTGRSGWAKDLDAGLLSYRKRLLDLGNMCEKNKVIPVFITQPTLLGNDTDPLTGVYLGAIKFETESGLHYWFVLNKYNQVLRDLCIEKHWVCIDAARQLAHSSDNFYDFFHYTKNGSREMTEIVTSGLIKTGLLH